MTAVCSHRRSQINGAARELHLLTYSSVHALQLNPTLPVLLAVMEFLFFMPFVLERYIQGAEKERTQLKFMLDHLYVQSFCFCLSLQRICVFYISTSFMGLPEPVQLMHLHDRLSPFLS